MSKIADELHNILDSIFPFILKKRIYREFFVNFRGRKLFFDFFIKELNIFIEVQGIQHSKFNTYFHEDGIDLVKQKFRDNLKIEYIQKNEKYSLIRFNYDEILTEELVRNKIRKVMNSKDRFFE